MVQQQTLCPPQTDGADDAETVPPPAFVPDTSKAPHGSPAEGPFGRRSGEVDFVMVDRSFSLRGRLRSFRYAIEGIATIFRSQHNAWIHCLGTLAVCIMGVMFGISSAEWCWLIPAIMVVWTAEALNTAFELLCDVTSPRYHPLVKKAKDASAGAVLICAVGSTVVGILVFGPHIRDFVSTL